MAEQIQSDDDFSVLPYPLLSTIVSFLSFKEAARTSILSKKWRPVWLSTENMEFDEDFFLKLDGSPEGKEIQRRAFIDFMKIWISNYQASAVDNLTLKFSDPENFIDDIKACIGFAIAHKVKKLAIDLSDPNWDEEDGSDVVHPPLFDLPLEMYKHDKLESLSMFSCNFRAIDCKKIFGNLKQLSLGWIELSNCCLNKMVKHCKMLESLTLKRCWNLSHVQIEGKDLRLTRMVLDKCSFQREELSLMIHAPNLVFFKYCGSMGVFDLQLSNYLDEVDLDFAFEEEHDEALSNFLAILLDDIYRVRALTVCSFTLQVIPNGDEPLALASPINVRHLTMNVLMHPNEFYGIKFLLKSCPILETLVIQLGRGRALPEYEPPLELNPMAFWADKTFVYKCFIKSLKVVEVNDFSGAIFEFCFLFYILSVARALKELKIRVITNNPELRASLMERLQFLRNYNSPSTELVVSIL